MVTRVRILAALAMIVVVGVTGCSKDSNDESSGESVFEKPVVYSVNYPLAYFAERIGGDKVEVVLPVPADIDPPFWQPEAADVTAFQNADIILLNGATYAKWVAHVSLPSTRMVNTSHAFSDNYLTVETGATHRHGPSGEHAHHGTAFTTWLDLAQAAEQARAVKDALSAKAPAYVALFDERFQSLEAELREVDEELRRAIASAPVVGSHPVYQYAERRYGLNTKSVMWEPDEMPDERQWRELSRLLEAHPAQWMVWESSPDAAIAARLASMGVKSAVFDPCGNRPASGDFMTTMRANAQQMTRVYSDR